MIVGRGLVARAFDSYNNDDKVLIYASGVSDSKCEDEKEYNREKDLLVHTINSNSSKHIIYISTCSIYNPAVQDTAYVKHKLKMEGIVKELAKSFNLFRVSNLVGETTNNKTVFNFFKDHVKSGKHFYLWVNAYRNLIDSDDFYKIAQYAIEHAEYHNRIVNIANATSYKVSDIIKELENFYKVEANYTELAKGEPFTIDTSDALRIMQDLNLSFDENTYLHKLVAKYCQQ